MIFYLTVIELKKWIYENNKVQFILEQIGCHHIIYHETKEYYSCGNPDGDNNAAINVYNNEYLNCIDHTRNIGEKPDIIDLVEYIKKLNFKDTIKWLHQLLELKLTYQKTQQHIEKIDPLHIFKKVKCRKLKTNVADIEYLNENVLCDFIPNIHIDLFREGITQQAIEKFELGYSYKMKRTIFPYRYWLNGELVGYTGRTSIKDYKAFEISKYFITPNYKKNLNLYGLWENYDDIQKIDYVTVFESEKSVIKRYSRCDKSCVALSGHTISDEQIKILIGLNVKEIVIALDKDVDINEMRYACEKFYGIRNVSYIFDKYNLLGKKDSPADAQNKIYEYLFKYRVKYDEKEHREYLKSLKRS